MEVDGDLVERAWRVVNAELPPMGATIADAKKGPLWRPVRKLLRKARTARAEALRTKSGRSGQEPEPEPGLEQHAEPPQPTQSIPMSQAQLIHAEVGTDDQMPSGNGPWTWESLGGLLNYVDLSTLDADFATAWTTNNGIWDDIMGD